MGIALEQVLMPIHSGQVSGIVFAVAVDRNDQDAMCLVGYLIKLDTDSSD